MAKKKTPTKKGDMHRAHNELALRVVTLATQVEQLQAQLRLYEEEHRLLREAPPAPPATDTPGED